MTEFFTLVSTAFIYPLVGAWTWGGGRLAALGFQDFAGSTIVHGTDGAAALTGALVVGPRHNKFRSDGTVTSTPPSNIPVVTLKGVHQAAGAVEVDDGVGAVPAHLFAGVWGTIATVIADEKF